MQIRWRNLRKEYLFESDKQAFENTVSMTQAEIRTGREMKEVLQNSMANLRSSKDAAIDLRKAIDHLKARRRQMRKDPVFAQIDNLRKQQGSWQYDAQALNEYEQEERDSETFKTKEKVDAASEDFAVVSKVIWRGR